MKEQINVSCSVDNLKKIRDFISQSLGEYMPNKDKEMVVLAIDEICANLICHCHYPHKTHISVHVVKNELRNEFEFLIKNRGDQFDYGSYSEPTLSEIVKQKRKGGMGMMLVRRIMDDIDFFQEGGINVCKLVKKSSIPFKKGD